MGKVKKICIFIFSLFLSFPLPAAEAIRVGFMADSNIIQKNEDGSVKGYLVEFLLKIIQETDTPYKIEYVEFHNIDELFEALESGIVDLIPGAADGQEGKQGFLVCNHEIAMISDCLLAATDRDDLAYGDLAAIDGIKVAVQKGYPAIKDLLDFCQSAGFSVQIEEYRSQKEVYDAVRNGRADVCLYAAGSNTGFKSIMNIKSTPLYLLINKDKAGLMQELGRVIGRILSETPDYEYKLYHKYFIQTKKKTCTFTREEKEWIKGQPKQTIAVTDYVTPFFYFDRKNRPKGILVEYFSGISSYTGLAFEYKPFKSHEEAALAVIKGEADILAAFSGGVLEADKLGLRLTAPLLTGNLAALVKKEDSFDRKGTVTTESWCIPLLGEGYDIVTVTNLSEGFDMLRKNKTDAMVGDFTSMLCFLNTYNSAPYKVVVLQDKKYEISPAILSQNRTLGAILDKASNMLSGKMDDFLLQYNLENKSVFSVLSSLNPAVTAAIAVLFFVIMVCGAIAASIIIRRQHISQKILQKEKEVALREAKTNEERNFLTGISHDIRTPLNAIIGYAELAEDEQDLQKLHRYYENIRASSAFLLDLVNDLLTISKCSSNKFQTKLEPVKSDTLHIPIREQIAYAAAKKGITFTTDISSLRPRVILCDQLNLQKILLNLLTNAIKYTPQGGLVNFSVANDIFSSTGMLSYDGYGDTIVTVTDNGIGMSKEFQKKMFAPFSQEMRSGFAGQGTGLGLSIAKQLTDVMGGRLSVQSEINKGTTFTLRLHFQDADPSLLEIKENATSAATKSGTFGAEGSQAAKKTILACEDNEINREMLKALFERLGYNVDTAASGLECLAAFEKSQEGKYAAIFMDLNMPVMGGLEATGRIRKLARKDALSVPIIAMSGDTSSTVAGKCKKAGMNDYIAKPAAVKEIKECLEKYI